MKTFASIRLWAVLGLALSTLAGIALLANPASGSNSYEARTRTYYIAAEDVDWNFAPDGKDVAMGEPFNDDQKVFVEGNGKTRVGSTYRKSVFREYTDATFTTQKPRPASEAYLGMLGPIIHAVVGDKIEVVFKNNTKLPHCIHPHGVVYDKTAEGAYTNDGNAEKADDVVAPGATYTYRWKATEKSGPGPADPSSRFWLYHSHYMDGIADEYAGLIGGIVVTKAEFATESGVPSDVDQEVTSLYMVDNENASALAEENFKAKAPACLGADAEEVCPADEFEESNLMHTINGYVYGNGPRVKIKQGAHVRWYLAALGTEVDLHTPHWHGNTVLERGHNEDVTELMPATMKEVDMIADNPGVWMFHCHVNDHISAGMMSLYEVTPADGTTPQRHLDTQTMPTMHHSA